MKPSLPDDLITLLLDTDGEPDHAAMLVALNALAGPRQKIMIEARITLQRAAAEHKRALYILSKREKLIADEALKLLERLSREESK